MELGYALMLLALPALGFALWRLREEMERRRAAEAKAEQAAADALGAKVAAARADDLARELSEARARVSEADAALAGAREREAAFAREREDLTRLRAEVETKFAALAQDALAKSNEAFLKLAGETLAKQQSTAEGGLKAREEAMRALLTPIHESFTAFKSQVKSLEETRLRDHSVLGEQIRKIGESLEATRTETGKLATALRAQPKTRGRWGEEQLRNILELAGMSAHCDFHTEVGVRDDEDRLHRPDVTVRLPGGAVLVIDAKAPMEAYLDAVDAPDDAAREAALVRHAKQVREHARALAKKSYWDKLENSPDFVAMFIPGENFYAAAAERDPDLFQKAVENRVIIVTPATLVALAKAAAFGWRQEEAAKRAQDVAQLGKTLYDRLATFGSHMAKLGKALESGVKSYNQAVGSLEAKVMPSARKFQELEVFETAAPAPELPQIELAARLPAPGRDLRLGSSAADVDGEREAAVVRDVTPAPSDPATRGRARAGR